MSFRTLLNRLIPRPYSNRERKALRPAASRLALESLEDRLTPAAALSIWNASILEGNTGTQNVAVTVTLSQPHSNSVSVNYRTADGTAFAGSDYNAVSGTLNFAKNVMSKTILVPVRGDTVLEPDEYFFVRLDSAKAGARIANGQAMVTIMNNEPFASIGDASPVVEGDGGTTPMQFTVTLSNFYDSSVSVKYATRDGSATAPGDYLAQTGTLTFAPHSSTPQVITIDVIGDQVPELNENFFVDLTSPDGSVTIIQGTAVGTISDNEPRISISDASVLEGDDGTTLMQFAVSISNAYGSAVTVNYATSDGSATSPGDYLAKTGALTFVDATPQMITIEVVGDKVPELDKSFFVNVTTPNSYAAIDRGTAVGTIWDDEPRIYIYDAYNYGESTISFTVSVSNLQPEDGLVTVNFTTVDYSAIAGDPNDPNAFWDYVAASGPLTFDSDNPTYTITIDVNTSTFVYDKSFNIQLSNASSNALLANELATGYAYNGYYYDYGYYDYGYYDYYYYW